MSRRRPELLEEHKFTAGGIARTLTRSRASATYSRTHSSASGDYSHGSVPTQHGFVRFDRWRDETHFQLILDGSLYSRVDHEQLDRRAIYARAGMFAKRAAEFHSSWLAAGGNR
jgi:hypothetical protein